MPPTCPTKKSVKLRAAEEAESERQATKNVKRQPGCPHTVLKDSLGCTDQQRQKKTLKSNPAKGNKQTAVLKPKSKKDSSYRASDSEGVLSEENTKHSADCTNLSVLDVTRATGFNHKDDNLDKPNFSNNVSNFLEDIDLLSKWKVFDVPKDDYFEFPSYKRAKAYRWLTSTPAKSNMQARTIKINSGNRNVTAQKKGQTKANTMVLQDVKDQYVLEMQKIASEIVTNFKCDKHNSTLCAWFKDVAEHTKLVYCKTLGMTTDRPPEALKILNKRSVRLVLLKKGASNNLERGCNRFDYEVLEVPFAKNSIKQLDNINALGKDLLWQIVTDTGLDVTVGLVLQIVCYAKEDVEEINHKSY
ncbi:uncharacterized protein FOMMEDRAFT_31428 [Fomitiporia mediterranea MF3/22]|uniref:uncharacterized protein n=1 Tax=Fomitiporia mediterranea (strain MF3/22) TaxID=694068 RepID=UPI0004408946|nr:uncharacterized protein FOMMEDRAFT_31428 [Fomitiporia mediterranea MF3/22]EJC99390.1 hypothetical protein FOMMEDRAFT_31428 [Fomitiporia mediterranea MF3/22]